MKLILIAAPGAGKGTQAEILGRMCNIPAISTGNILRAAIKEGSDMGSLAKRFIDNGELVPDDVVIDIVKERISRDDCRGGFILDGMPRTLRQGEALVEHGIDIDTALFIKISDEEVMHRLTGRRTCLDCGEPYHVTAHPPKREGVCDRCGGELGIRKDDAPETVKARLEAFHRQTEPLRQFYAELGKLVTVENQPTIEATTAEIVKALGL